VDFGQRLKPSPISRTPPRPSREHGLHRAPFDIMDDMSPARLYPALEAAVETMGIPIGPRFIRMPIPVFPARPAAGFAVDPGLIWLEGPCCCCCCCCCWGACGGCWGIGIPPICETIFPGAIPPRAPAWLMGMKLIC
jgi:hypothetical protein